MGSGPVANFGSNEIRVRHREFLGPINGTTSFLSTSYPLNPGMSTTFPWLSQLAANYEQYKMHGCVFQFVTTSATAVSSTNTALGQVVMATDYDALDNPYASSRAMLASLYSNYGVPCRDLVHTIECASRKSFSEVLYVRNTAPPTGADLRLYDVGNFQLATEGMQAGVTQIGGLWVSYDVTFMKPQLQDSSSDTQSMIDTWTSSSDGQHAFAGGVIAGASAGNISQVFRTDLIEGNTVQYALPFANTNDVILVVCNANGSGENSLMTFNHSTETSILGEFVFPTTDGTNGVIGFCFYQYVTPGGKTYDWGITLDTAGGTAPYNTSITVTYLASSALSWPWQSIGPSPQPPEAALHYGYVGDKKVAIPFRKEGVKETKLEGKTEIKESVPLLDPEMERLREETLARLSFTRQRRVPPELRPAHVKSVFQEPDDLLPGPGGGRVKDSSSSRSGSREPRAV